MNIENKNTRSQAQNKIKEDKKFNQINNKTLKFLLLNKKRNKYMYITHSNFFSSLRNIKFNFIKNYKFPLISKLGVLSLTMAKNSKVLKGYKILSLYNEKLFNLNNLNRTDILSNTKDYTLNRTGTQVKASMSHSLIDKATLPSGRDVTDKLYNPILKKENLKALNSIKKGVRNEELYNLSSLKSKTSSSFPFAYLPSSSKVGEAIENRITKDSSDYLIRNLKLSKKLDLAFSSSQSKEMQNNLFSKINSIDQAHPVPAHLEGSDNHNITMTSLSGLHWNEKTRSSLIGGQINGDSNVLSSNNIFTSLAFDLKSKNSKFLMNEHKQNLNKKRELPNQPNVKMAHTNYIVNPYKKNIKTPSFMSTYLSWKNGNSIYTLLKYVFERMSCLISKPYFYETPNRMIIQLFYYSKYPNPKNLLIYSNNNQANFNNSIAAIKSSNKLTGFLFNNTNKFNQLIILLSQIFNKQVILDITRLKRPYYDVTILNEILYRNVQHKKSRVIRIISSLLYVISKKYYWGSAHLAFSSLVSQASKAQALSLNKGTAPKAGGDELALGQKIKVSQIKNHDALRGFKLKLGGRLLSQKIIPRISSKTYERGKLTRGKVHFINSSRIYGKHKRGAYSITIHTGSVIL
jgi:hypothetical protein